MKARTTLLAFGLGITTLALWAAPSLGMKGGTDILHMTLRTGLAPTGADPDAAGMLVGMLRQQGKADIQKLRLAVSHLAPDSTYHLFVMLRGALTPTEVLTFDTDANGEATLNLMHHGNGKGGKTFPLGLDPLSDVVGIEIHDDADVDVLDADLTTPDGFQYLVKRRLTPDLNVDPDAEGALFLKAHDSETSFRLVAANLDPGKDYTLAVGDGVNPDATAMVTADANGRLETTDLPVGAPDALHILTVKLMDGASIVLDATLPSP